MHTGHGRGSGNSLMVAHFGKSSTGKGKALNEDAEKVRHPVFPRRLRSQYWRGLTALLFLIRNELRSFRRRMAELAADGAVRCVRDC